MEHMVPAPDALIGKRFDVAVAKMLGISRAKAADVVTTGQARVLGRHVDKAAALQAGDLIEFDLVEERKEPEPIATDMRIVYEDDDVVVVDKPVGVAAHASVGWTGPTVLGSLLDRGVHITSYGAPGRQGIVSRLDVGTSGLMLVCKSELAYKEMRRQFAEHEVVKTYHALAQGNLKEDKATIELRSDAPKCPTSASASRRPARKPSRIGMCWNASARRHWRKSIWKRDARTRSASISPQSAIRWWETPCMGPIPYCRMSWGWNASGCTPCSSSSDIRARMCGRRFPPNTRPTCNTR
ncbi:Ribosomal large subunit pseudouridine synthase D [Bifidobacterium magnum]|uniref:RNA pseudouridylate synthase n=1 Tax=Bifidobacterium magnum TaxID=1692 RepID=A0A087BDU3_9BIFI|nr:Ribosomal large subunit pseudouridine synthase D [Bifidobacterium magnum]